MMYIYIHIYDSHKKKLTFIEFQPLQRHRTPSVLNWCVMQTFTQTTPCHLNQAWLLIATGSFKIFKEILRSALLKEKLLTICLKTW